jgi:hypothetical protein
MCERKQTSRGTPERQSIAGAGSKAQAIARRRAHCMLLVCLPLLDL